MRILITSTSHPEYNKTGIIIRDSREEGLHVRLDGTDQVVIVPNGQFKMIR